jgi:hypothetical protein
MTEQYKLMYLDVRWKEIRDRIISLDNNKCRICGKNKDLHVHHLKYHDAPYITNDTELLTLCQFCHSNIHRFNIKINFKFTIDTDGKTCYDRSFYLLHNGYAIARDAIPW